MYPDSSSTQYYRSISEDPTQHPATQRPGNVLLQRAESMPSGPGASLNKLYAHIISILVATKAALGDFINIYPTVWNVDLPAEGVTLHLQDALQLLHLPGLAALVADPDLKISNVKLVQQMLQQMKANLVFSLDAESSNDALHAHGQVMDLLNRAETYIGQVLILTARIDHGQQTEAEVPVPSINSARTIMASALIITAFIRKLENNQNNVSTYTY